MEKKFRMYVTNIDEAIRVLASVGIEAKAVGTSIQFVVEETRKTELILLLNKEKVVVYDIEEI